MKISFTEKLKDMSKRGIATILVCIGIGSPVKGLTEALQNKDNVYFEYPYSIQFDVIKRLNLHSQQTIM